MLARMALSRFLNRPLALTPSYVALIRDLYTQSAPSALMVPQDVSDTRERRPYSVAAGVAVIQIKGVLVHGQGCWWWEEMSYDAVTACLAQALEDGDVNAIVLHIDSPGGDVAGMLDVADAVYAMRGTKPVWAIVDEMACSAAYAIASAAEYVTTPRTGQVGSIGVFVAHVDITKSLDDAGIKITTIQFGDQKSDGQPTTPLTDDALGRMQADVDAMGGMFVDLVARNRSLTTAKVKATQAGIFLGAAGVAQGLADAVMSPDAAFLALLKKLG